MIKYRLIIFVNEYGAMIIVPVNEAAVVKLINQPLRTSPQKEFVWIFRIMAISKKDVHMTFK